MPRSAAKKYWPLLAAYILIFLAAGVLYVRARGPYHDYELSVASAARSGQLEVGAARRGIAPDLDAYDSWTDVDGDGAFDPEVDTWEDRNEDGDFDGCWLAGFGNTRPATGIHDEPQASALALRQGGITLVLVTLDSIGLFHNDTIAIRNAIDPALGVSHVLVSSTHAHEVPDTMKIWSGPWRFLGFEERYLAYVREQAVVAVEAAVAALAPADVTRLQLRIGPEGFVRDARPPEVLDPTLYALHFTRAGSEDTLATLVNWGNHPETLGGDNTLITADFVHFLREGVEQGVADPNGYPGLGGICLYFQGQIGGLMTPLEEPVPHRDGEQVFTEPSFEKAQALGENLALIVNEGILEGYAAPMEAPRLAFAARTVKFPVDGTYQIPMLLGLIHEGYYLGGYAKTELNALRIGDLLFLGVPGEIYPEIVEGGIVAKDGRDFDVPPLELPPLREVMEAMAPAAAVIGLANDEIGYIIPKSQWDNEAPYVYGEQIYGEINSGGPDVAPALHAASLALLRELDAVWKVAVPAPQQ